MASSFFFREDAFLDEVVGDHGFSLSRTLAIADLEEVQRRDAIDLFDRELGILHVTAFMLKFLTSGLEFVINAMEFRIFMIAQRFDWEAVADIVILFMRGRAISLRSIRTAFGAMPSGHTRLCARLCARPLRGLCAYAGARMTISHLVYPEFSFYTFP